VATITHMNEPLTVLIEHAAQLAWDVLERSGELGEPRNASNFLVDAIAHLTSRGEHRQLVLANRAIDFYRQQRRLGLIV